MEIPSFIFGGNTGIDSAGELQRTRGVADALQRKQASRVAQNPWEGINSVTEALVARQLGERADAYEQEQREQAAGQFDSLFGEGSDPSIQDLAGALGNDFATDGQQSVINALLGQKLKQQDPSYQMGLERDQLELDALRNPLPPERNILEDAGGRKRYQDTGEYVFDDVSTGNKAPTVQKIAGPDGSQVAVQWEPEANQWVPIVAPEGGGAVSDKTKLTEGQSKLALFGRMQSETAPVLDELESQFDPANIQDAVARSTPIGGNFFQSEEGQIYNTAAAAWSEGALRIATGAAATEPEIERMRNTYFAQVGDTPNTIKFKSNMRQMYSRALDAASGQKNIEGQLPNPMDFAENFARPDGPQEGETVDGFVFKGGDPADKNNWERVL